MTRLVTVERRILTGSLHTVPEVHRLFTRHKLEWMAQGLGTYNEEILTEFYASYVATLRGSIDRRVNLPNRTRSPTLHRFLYGPTTKTQCAPMTLEFDYRWETVRSGAFQRTAELRENMKKWLAQHLAIEGESANWVLDPRGLIKKASLTFTTEFFWLLVRHCLSPTNAIIFLLEIGRCW